MIHPMTPGRWLALAALAAALGADDPPPKGYVSPRAAAPIKVDGRLEDLAWREIPWTDDFVDIEGDAKPRPRFRTRAKMTWDDGYFYVGALLEEPDGWGTLKAHDSVIFRDNDFELFIDPDGDNHAYFELEINALNTEWDLLLEKPYRDGGPAVSAREIPGLLKAVHVDGTLNHPSDIDRSWSVELAIPWAALAGRANRPAPPADGDTWRVNFSRVEWETTVEANVSRKVPQRPEANWVWSPQGAIDMHRPERWGYVQFSTAPAGRAAFRPDPSGPARDRLMRVYHAQRAHRARTGTWAADLAGLGLPVDADRPVAIELVGDGYRASIAVPGPGGRPGSTWTVRGDSKLESRPAGR